MIIDGKQIAASLLQDLKKSVTGNPTLVFMLVGNNPDSLTYVRLKKIACEKIGINSIVDQLDEKISHNDLLSRIKVHNEDPSVDAILIQQPLPSQIKTHEILSAIDPKKDVDGFHPTNLGKLVLGDTSGLMPCTPKGVLHLLDSLNIEIEGKQVVVLGRSAIVGKPLAALLLNRNATVTIAHSKTKNLAEITKRADILCVAIGKPKFITSDMVKEGAVVIDIGITNLVGDVDFDSVKNKCSAITPVPGGVGPMTIAMLLSNTLLAASRR